MTISMSNQLMITLYAVMIGVVMGVVYDIIRILRICVGAGPVTRSSQALSRIRLPLIGARAEDGCEQKKRGEIFKDIYVFFGDILFFVILSLVFVIFIYQANNGRLRWYLPGGAIAGFAAYYFTVGRLVMLFSGTIIFAASVILRYLWFFLSTPVKLAARLLCRIFVGSARKIYIRITKRMLYRAMIKDTKRMIAHAPGEVAGHTVNPPEQA